MNHVPVILGLDVASPAMLWWLVAAGVPLVIHLWSRQRYRETAWAAMEYLLAALRASRRRIRFEKWLLLVIRMLIIMLIVAAVAEPFFERMGFALVTGERTHRVFVVDGSYSMAYQPTEMSRFDRARELATQIVQASSQGDGFTLVLMSDPPQVVVNTPVFEPTDFLSEIDDLTLPHHGADLPTTLARVDEILQAARREHPKLGREEVYFLTDLGRVGWLPGSARSVAWNDFHERSRRLAERAALIVIDVGQVGAENVAITGVRSTDSFVTAAGSTTIEAELKNFGRESQNRLPVELFVEGRRIRQESVRLSPGAETSVVFSYPFETPGDYAVEVRLSGDRLDVDNHRWLALPVKQAVRVLCIDGRPSATPFGSATDYLFFALAPNKNASKQAVVQAEIVPESRLLETDLDRYDCLFLANVAQFTAGEARALENYLKAGGALVFFLGNQVVASRYNKELAGERPNATRILPARLGQIVEEPQSRLDPLGYRHPIVRPFRGFEKAGLLSTRVEKYFKLLVPKRSKAEVVVALGNGDPLVVEEPIHRGRVVLFATSAEPSWTFMPKWHSFVPMVRETLAYVTADKTALRNVAVGDPLGDTPAGPAADAPLKIQRPDGQMESVTSGNLGDVRLWSYQATDTSGIYTARFGPQASRRDVFAVNVDTTESDLTKLSPDQLREKVWPDVPFVHQTSWEDIDDEPMARIARPSRLSKVLLYAVLVLLLVETFLARRFGYPAT
jgi:hypothetical protein